MCAVAVTGMGIVSSLGKNLFENYQSLNTGKTGISTPEILQTNYKDLPVGEIKINNTRLSNDLGLNPGHSYTRAALLGCMAVRELLHNSGLSEFDPGTGFISGTTVGGMDMTESFFDQFSENSENLRYIQAQHPGFTTEKIAAYFGLNAMVTTISTACSSSANAIMLGARLIESGRLKRVIVGGTDCLTRFTLNGFNSLKILSGETCKPFDENRNGLNLGEAAAYLLLEADEMKGNRPAIARISGYGNANDAFHQTASSQNGEGAYLAMKKAIEKAGVDPVNINYINAHGTGTGNNDLSESVAIKRVFGDHIPEFSSTKALTGHTLGAAGAVEAVISIMAIQNQEVFPNLNFSQPIRDTGLMPETKLHSKQLNYVLSNSFGFGGNCTSLIFRNE
ncbi:beta-ketoacyl-[acyl-carrier-protein] synthase family protein [Gramella sp. GC03-9]|uniref:Beta-ketoacyl-[acyl-carrier-protein] synthase family protein n=1 Tax=Christiangramia oceanisediminis TaxID=2920386 RepID=A0A9X2R8T5_9FLAO|nr:beta-ketoacyl-[acyl-carrier-protein] synthase family protein [Gramella oceanisediminis]MCP9200468.1 beta-ketoacyl-[acyl-carrier-protein] synthase family protein [Gramella oceanisediminis]